MSGVEGAEPGPRARTVLIALSPLALIALGFGVAFVSTPLIGAWSWVPLALVYWLALGLCIRAFGGARPARRWLRRPERVNVWTVLSLLIGVFPLLILAMNIHLLDSALLVTLWLLFAFVNPWFEQFYWRGVLLDSLPFGKGFNIAYSAVLFAASHPMMWGVFSVGNRSWHVWVFLIAAGVVWAMAYRTTRSLRIPLISHIIVDIGNLSVFVFLNIYVPPQV